MATDPTQINSYYKQENLQEDIRGQIPLYSEILEFEEQDQEEGADKKQIKSEVQVTQDEVDRLLGTGKDEFMDIKLAEKVLLNIDNDESSSERSDGSLALSILE